MNIAAPRPDQLPASDLPDRLWDALVIGAGPAGSACAARLALSGHGVLLLDRAPFPRPKVCGGALLADAVAALERLGALGAVRAAAHPVSGLRLFSPSQVEVTSRGAYLTLGRHALDDLLARHATATGATFAQAEIRDLRIAPAGVEAVGSGGAHLRARFAVLATGARLSLARRIGLAGPADGMPDALAVCRQVRSFCRLDGLLVSFDRSVLPGYAWIFPQGGGEYNVGCGMFHRASRRRPPNLGANLDAFCREFPPARDVLAAASRVGPLEGAPLRCGLRGARPAAGPVLCVGETVGTTYPFTGEGIGKAMETGELAAQAIDAALSSGDPADLTRYPEALERRLRPKYRGYQTAEAWVRWPWLIDFLARRVTHSRHLQRAAAGVLSETADPTRIFSVGGVLRSLLF